ncbi:MAG: glycerol-3-phosphate acyltransferase [Candidatus Shapirobacteria bacterium]|jgi:acyl-phosphate glycerol 3-phosphate acyltransferase
MSIINPIVISYLIGCFPTALIIVYLFTGQDVRSGGSGNMGALNTLRTVKKEKRSILLAAVAFLIVALTDIFKGILVLNLFPDSPVLATFFVILGHNYPVFLKFYGGRGAATLMGIIFYYQPIMLIVWLLTLVIFMYLTEFVFFIKKKFKGRFPSFSHIISDQILGRLIGEIFALVPIFLINPTMFLPVLVGTILVLIRHHGRLQKQLKAVLFSK